MIWIIMFYKIDSSYQSGDGYGCPLSFNLGISCSVSCTFKYMEEITIRLISLRFQIKCIRFLQFLNSSYYAQSNAIIWLLLCGQMFCRILVLVFVSILYPHPIAFVHARRIEHSVHSKLLEKHKIWPCPLVPTLPLPSAVCAHVSHRCTDPCAQKQNHIIHP